MPKAAPSFTERREPDATARFDLRVERAGDSFRAEVVGARLHGAQVLFPPPFSEEDLRKLRRVLEDPPRRELVRAGEDLGNFPKKLGTRLFKAVFKERILEAWQEARGRASEGRRRLILALHLREAEVLSWPWEYLYDPGDDLFLGLSRETPIVRYTAGAADLPALSIQLPVRVLVVLSSPRTWHPLDGEREWGHLGEALADLITAGKVALERLEHATLPALSRQLARNRYQVLHFIGHGSFHQGEGALIFEDESGGPAEVGAGKLATILLDAKLRLAVLNACHGARCSADDSFTGVAQSLIRREVAAVVAMQCSVSDQFALLFSRLFYDRLARGGPVDLAMADARCGLFADQYEIEWGNAVLYTRSSDGHIFEVGESIPVGDAGIPWWRWIALALSLIALTLLLIAPHLGYKEGEGAQLGPSSADQAPPEPRSTATVETDPRCPSPPIAGVKFAFIPEGELSVGSRRKKVLTIPEPYCIGKFEVTNGQWAQVMGGETGDERDLPAHGKSLRDAQDFVQGLERLYPGSGYRLPTRGEWEYAHRAGRRDDFSYGDNVRFLPKYGNCRGGDSYHELAPVGQFEPNDFGLYDMHGNVWEWTSDEDPKEKGKWIRMGGSWNILPKYCTVDRSESSRPDADDAQYGFRIVRKPVPLGQK